MWALCKKEFRQFFSNLTGYLAIGVFLLLNGLFLFIFSSFNIFDFGYASLDNFFTLAPFVLLVLIPAVSMRQISDEWRGGTMELLQTSPLTNLQIIGGKYFAALFVTLIAILPTITYAVSVSMLSAAETVLDQGAWAGSYMGLILLCAVFCAISLFAGSFSQNSVVSFLVGAAGCIIFYKGFSVISSLPVFSNGADYYLQQAGLEYHYRSISRGVIDIKDLVYFFSVILLFIYLTILRIAKNQSTEKNLLSFVEPRFRTGFLVAIIFILNLGVSLVNIKADLTSDQRYSLSPATKKLLQSIEEPIEITILLEGDFPASFRKLQSSTKDLLNEMKSYAGPNLRYRFLAPSSLIKASYLDSVWFSFRDSLKNNGVPVDSILQQQPGLVNSFKQEFMYDFLKRWGVMPYNLQVQQDDESTTSRLVFPAALIIQGDDTLSVDLLSGKTEYTRDPLTGSLVNDEARSIGNAEAMLEFKFASAISKIIQTTKPAVAYLVGNGEPMGPETQKLVETINNEYNFGLVDINKNSYIPTEISALLIVKPTTPFSDSAKRKIDQYVMQGGKVLWFIDQLYAEKDSLAITAKTVAYDRGLNIDDLLFKYGVRINRDLLQDLQCDYSKMVVGISGDKPQLADVPFNYYPLLTTSSKHTLTRNMEPVLGQFCNTLDTVKSPGINKSILLSSSANAKTLSTPAIISLEELKSIEKPELFNKKNIPVAALLEGPFQSLYTHRTDAAMQDSFKKYYGDFRTTAPPTGCQFVIADGDIILNDYTREGALPIGYSRTRDMSYSNKQFVENILAYMTGMKDILSLRNREIQVRLLDKSKLAQQKNLWQIINVALPVLMIIIGGLGFSFWRKRIYTLS